jgi:NADPH-dependent 2,4-dienoyl-CoA reductase/sulfur reductase-like enzyme
MGTTTLVVGASVAGARVASDLRRNGYGGSIVLVDGQPDLPYDRPPLSKAMLTGPEGTSTSLLTREDAAARDIELRLGVRARSLDIAASAVTLEDGTELHYDDLVIATGADPRPTPWPRHPRVLELRTLADGRALRQALRSSRSVLIVGAGFIGAEVSSAARSLGLDVSIVDPLPVPMGRLFGDEVGRYLSALHAEHGVTTHFGIGVAAIDPDERQVTVTLADRSVLSVDLVVVGIGVLPNVGWLESSGLLLDNGVLCDSRCRASGQTRIYAAGDVARWLHPRHGEHVRIEHWTNALEQAQHVAKAIAGGEDEDYAPVEYVWSDQYASKIQVVGSPLRGRAQPLITRSDPSRICALWSDQAGLLVGSVTVNWPKASVLSRRTMADGLPATAVSDALQS